MAYFSWEDICGKIFAQKPTPRVLIFRIRDLSTVTNRVRELGNSDLEITPLGIGAWAMGGPGWAFAWGHQDDKNSAAAIRAALDAGINWIDTAAIYGLGHSEEVVGKTLQGFSKKP